jgi:hypothetical protein
MQYIVQDISLFDNLKPRIEKTNLSEVNDFKHSKAGLRATPMWLAK